MFVTGQCMGHLTSPPPLPLKLGSVHKPPSRYCLTMLRARSDRASASAASLASKIQIGPRAMPSVIASDAATAAT